MTEQEAIEVIKYASAFNKENSPLTKALELATDALEKQVPMKPKRIIPISGHSYECAYCGNELEVSPFKGQYCHWCGQRLDWE